MVEFHITNWSTNRRAQGDKRPRQCSLRTSLITANVPFSCLLRWKLCGVRDTGNRLAHIVFVHSSLLHYILFIVQEFVRTRLNCYRFKFLFFFIVEIKSNLLPSLIELFLSSSTLTVGRKAYPLQLYCYYIFLQNLHPISLTDDTSVLFYSLKMAAKVAFLREALIAFLTISIYQTSTTDGT